MRAAFTFLERGPWGHAGWLMTNGFSPSPRNYFLHALLKQGICGFHFIQSVMRLEVAGVIIVRADLLGERPRNHHDPAQCNCGYEFLKLFINLL